MEARSEGRLREELSEQAKERSGRLKVLWRKYGAVGIGCYAGIYVGSISLLYVIYDYGVMTSMPSGGATVIEKVRFLYTIPSCPENQNPVICAQTTFLM